MMKVKVLLLAVLWGVCFSKDLSDLYLLGDFAVKRGALCLDGSSPGYYFRPGSGNAVTKWIIHFEGGGWCYNEQDCYQRSKTAVGSSKSWTLTENFEGKGILTPNRTVNPTFYNWNMVYMKYCDGASFSGDKYDPIVVNGTTLYFRGHRILAAHFDHLLSIGLEDATEVIQTGCSAGGLSTYLHLDYVRQRLKPTTKLVGLPDAGFFLDIPDISGNQIIRGQFQYVFRMQNTSNGLDSDCIANTPLEDQWKCIFAQYTYPYIQTPIFVINSEYDSWQLGNILAPSWIYKWGDCYGDPAKCNSTEIAQCQGFRTDILTAMQKAGVLNTEKKNGAWLCACWYHCITITDYRWNHPKVNGSSPAELFTAWYYKQGDSNYKHVDCAYPCNTSC